MNVLKKFPDLCKKLEKHPSAALRKQFQLRILKHPSAQERWESEMLEQEPLRSILSNRKAEGWWYMDSPAGVYKKYEGWVWSLLFAAELGAPRREKRLRQSCEYFMEQCFSEKNGAFESAGRPSRTIACFVAHACYFLTYFGYETDPRVKSAFQSLGNNLGSDGGMRCFVMDTCLNETCTMAIPKFLKASSLLTPAERKKLLGSSVEKSASRLFACNIDRYQPVETTQWHKFISGKPLKEIRAAKAKFHVSGEYKIKSTWTRFQFPLHYDSDLLETLIYLGRLKFKSNEALQLAAHRILTAGQRDGWKAGRTLKGKLWSDLPYENDWITLRALEALSYYG